MKTTPENLTPSPELGGLCAAELLAVIAGFQQKLALKDQALRYSSAGIHKDDFIFNLGGYPVKRFGSQGQQKSFAVALKLAQFDFTRNLIGFKPILLFDDIFDKLDPARVQQLIQLVDNDSFGQIFITDTEPERIKRVFEKAAINHRVFEIQNGSVDFKY